MKVIETTKRGSSLLLLRVTLCKWFDSLGLKKSLWSVFQKKGGWKGDEDETQEYRRGWRLTAICPPSSVRYALTSCRATRAHCLQTHAHTDVRTHTHTHAHRHTHAHTHTHTDTRTHTHNHTQTHAQTHTHTETHTQTHAQTHAHTRTYNRFFTSKNLT